MTLFYFILWWLSGTALALYAHRLGNDVTRRDIVMGFVFGLILGPLTGVIFLVPYINWGKVVIKRKGT